MKNNSYAHSDQLLRKVLRGFDEEFLNFLSGCERRTYRSGELLLRNNSYLKTLPLVLTGSVRIYRQSDEREILLYYAGPGDTCMLALICCQEQKLFPAEAVAVRGTEALLIPSLKVDELKEKFPCWNNFMIRTFIKRHQQLLDSLNSLAFCSVEERIRDYLRQLSEEYKNDVIRITHQELANDLGTSRVVISRILKTLEIEGNIQQLRGAIRIRNSA